MPDRGDRKGWLRLWLWILGGVAAATGVFLVVTWPTPVDGLDEQIPTVKALARYSRTGDGYSNSNRAGKTRIYFHGKSSYLRITPQLRRAIADDMADQGFDWDRNRTYEKSTTGQFPIHSYVILNRDGTVVVGAWRSKWPQMIQGVIGEGLFCLSVAVYVVSLGFALWKKRMRRKALWTMLACYGWFWAAMALMANANYIVHRT